jgi:glucose-1-phosphate cytidylyltransferase
MTHPKVVILAGGLGTRLSEETSVRPKPLVEIGGRPILWHIMKTYSYFGFNDFIICCGYKGYLLKEYFINYFLHVSDVTVDFAKDEISYFDKKAEPWRVTLVDTGDHSMTGGRLARIKKHVEKDPFFLMTYGDGLADINVRQLVKFHELNGRLATVTAVHPPGRFGALRLAQSKVIEFTEKPLGDGNVINGGFFVLSPKVLDLIADDSTIWEQDPLRKLAQVGELNAFEHSGFWQPMDTLRDKQLLEGLWESGVAPWKVWEK